VLSEDGLLSEVANAQPIIALPYLDRLVFVICILERNSIHDCALLLGRHPRDISEARQRVVGQLVQIDESNQCSLRSGEGFAQIVRTGGSR
jgi:hypothetical protein